MSGKCGGQCLRQAELLHEGERIGVLEVDEVAEALHARDRPVVDVVVDAGAVLHEIGEGHHHVLGHVGDRHDKRRAGHVRA
jgi:hypothetical protein